MSVHKKMFPIGGFTHALLFLAAWVIGVNAYQSFLGASHEDYSDAFKTTQVVPGYLSDYASSSLLKAHPQDRIKGRDLANLMIASGISKARDMEDPKAIFDLENGGSGAFLASALAQKNALNSDITLAQAMQGEKNKNGETVGTLQVLATLFFELGSYQSDGNTPLSGNSAGRDKTIEEIVELLSKHLAGAIESCPFHRTLCNPLNVFNLVNEKVPEEEVSCSTLEYTDYQLVKTNIDIADSLKKVMRCKFNFYTNDVKTKDPKLGKCYYDNVDQKLVCGENADASLKSRKWFVEEPDRLSEAVFRFSYLMVSELYNHENVKSDRFAYQAMKGKIQLLILVLVFYIGLLLLWRFIACKHVKDMNEYNRFHLPVLIRGQTTTPMQDLSSSRGSIDQLINALPLIGLFGTVIGIIGALPNAAAAVSGSGPAVAQEINALFEQLGLAFSTTALAVLGVLILEFLWERLQGIEKVAVEKYFQN